MEIVASKEILRYFDTLMAGADKCYAVAEVARAKGFDPSLEIEIPQADDLASRVEKQLKELPLQNVAQIIREIAEDHGREETSLLVAKKVAKDFTWVTMGLFHVPAMRSSSMKVSAVSFWVSVW